MIIELLGPSGVGKTAIADALAPRLRLEGYAVQTVIWRRNHFLSRSLAKGVSTIRSCSPRAPQTRLASVLMSLLPPRSLFWSMRLRSYLNQLWSASIGTAAVTDITLLDQGFVQIITSLAQLSGTVDRHRIAEALAHIPKPDLVVRVETPLKVREVRLVERWKHLGLIQRWLELDLQTSLEQVKFVNILSQILTSNGQRFITVASTDKSSLAAAVEKILAEVRLMVDRAPAGALGSIGGATLLKAHATNGPIRTGHSPGAT
jgi:thymidylate kinase